MLFPRCLFLALLFTCLSVQAFAADSYRKVLFLGNSLTTHGPKADIDWAGDWGMAASAKAKDYVHLVTQAIAEKSGTAPEVFVRNIADFERAHAGYDLAGNLKEAVTFAPDLIVLAIGENVPALKTAEDKNAFQSSVIQLLTFLKADRQPTILVRGSFWSDPAKAEALQKACAALRGIYVNISPLSKDERNFARSERPFKHEGVANHPGDQGMAAIADAIVKALPK